MSGQASEAQAGDSMATAPVSLRALLSLPATAAFLLALVYALGAIARSAELSKAHISTIDAFTLIPIQQYLNRGIQVLVQPSFLIVPVAFVAAAIYLEFELARAPKKKRRRDWELRSKTARVVLIAILVAQLIGLILFRPLFVVGVGCGAVLLAIIFFAVVRRGTRKQRARNFLANPSFGAALFVLTVFLAGASAFFEFVYPAALPTVALVTEAAPATTGPPGPIAGKLVTFADGNWYVADAGGEIVAVNGQMVRSATIRPGHRGADPTRETLFQLLH
jgi:hypothetical protein